MTERMEQASRLFREGYNCSQSVVLAFADLLPVSPEHAAKLASSFGGGMGRLREVCGAVSGMLIVAGLLYGYGTPERGSVKQTHYERVQDLALAFEKSHGSLVCRELLGLKGRHDTPAPAPRTAEFYQKRPCERLICDAAGILEAYLRDHPPAQPGSERNV
ncbi:MAG: C_GCAxxG_C_C family protein [Clostridia bacterium]|nr:C_GCAxxG_C_C family protein [Clostridia bacterium]